MLPAFMARITCRSLRCARYVRSALRTATTTVPDLESVCSAVVICAFSTNSVIIVMTASEAPRRARTRSRARRTTPSVLATVVAPESILRIRNVRKSRRRLLGVKVRNAREHRLDLGRTRVLLIPHLKYHTKPFRKRGRQRKVGCHTRTNGHLEERKRTQESKKVWKGKKWSPDVFQG